MNLLLFIILCVALARKEMCINSSYIAEFEEMNGSDVTLDRRSIVEYSDYPNRRSLTITNYPDGRIGSVFAINDTTPCTKYEVMKYPEGKITCRSEFGLFFQYCLEDDAKKFGRQFSIFGVPKYEQYYSEECERRTVIKKTSNGDFFVHSSITFDPVEIREYHTFDLVESIDPELFVIPKECF